MLLRDRVNLFLPVFNRQKMKKSVVVLILAISVLVSACSTYTCPTYSQAHNVARETKF
jgi:PBP1b-binding outer membrane lipoprotein LpoB